jgi:glycine C-acetyltransferase
MFRHASRAFIFSAAMPPAQAAAAKAAFEVILDEPERVETLRRNAARFTQGLKRIGFDTMRTETAIVPVFCGADDRAFTMVSYCQHDNIFVLPVVSPAVPEGQARLRATVTAAHTAEDIDSALAVFEKAGKRTGII